MEESKREEEKRNWWCVDKFHGGNQQLASVDHRFHPKVYDFILNLYLVVDYVRVCGFGRK